MDNRAADASRSAVKAVVINGLGIALVFVTATFAHIRIPALGSGAMLQLGDFPLFVFALLFGKRTGAFAGAAGLALFDLLSGWTLWAPFTFLIGGAMGFLAGAAAEKNTKEKLLPYCISMLGAAFITAGGYYFTEVLLYGNWVTPLLSVYVNLLQTAVSAVLAFPLAKRLKKVVHTGP